MSDSITVFFADHHTMLRETLAALVSEDESIKVVGQTGDGVKVTAEVQRLKPDVVVLDMSLQGLNAFEICRKIKRNHSNAAILLLTMDDDEQLIATALEAGASGYILKETAADELNEAIRKVARGKLLLPTSIPRSRHNEHSYDRLTTRERKILDLIAQGKTNRAIAEELGLAVKTVDTHRRRLMEKLGVQNQSGPVKSSRKPDRDGPAGSPVTAEKDRPDGGELGALADSEDTLPQASGEYPRKEPEPRSLKENPEKAEDGRRKGEKDRCSQSDSSSMTERLRQRFRAIPPEQRDANQAFSIRVWRAISWLGKAEAVEDLDLRFICLWIAFNATYGHEEDPGRDAGDRRSWQSFLARLEQLDADDAIGRILRHSQADVLHLVDQKYLYRPFWQGADGWAYRQVKRRRATLKNYGKGYTLAILQELFESLYTLRIQMFHGAATSGSRLNRGNLERAVGLLGRFVPAMLGIMLAAGPEQDWGEVCFPPLNE